MVSDSEMFSTNISLFRMVFDVVCSNVTKGSLFEIPISLGLEPLEDLQGRIPFPSHSRDLIEFEESWMDSSDSTRCWIHLRLLSCGLCWDLSAFGWPWIHDESTFQVLASKWLGTWPSTSVATSRLSAFLSGCHLRQLNLSLVHAMQKMARSKTLLCEVVRRPNRQECQYRIHLSVFPCFPLCFSDAWVPCFCPLLSNEVQSPKASRIRFAIPWNSAACSQHRVWDVMVIWLNSLKAVNSSK